MHKWLLRRSLARWHASCSLFGRMATKQNAREAVRKLAEGKLDLYSSVAREIMQEIVERVFKGR